MTSATYVRETVSQMVPAQSMQDVVLQKFLLCMHAQDFLSGSQMRVFWMFGASIQIGSKWLANIHWTGWKSVFYTRANKTTRCF